jgi:hypothetical protein
MAAMTNGCNDKGDKMAVTATQGLQEGTVLSKPACSGEILEDTP